MRWDGAALAAVGVPILTSRETSKPPRFFGMSRIMSLLPNQSIWSGPKGQTHWKGKRRIKVLGLDGSWAPLGITGRGYSMENGKREEAGNVWEDITVGVKQVGGVNSR